MEEINYIDIFEIKKKLKSSFIGKIKKGFNFILLKKFS